MAVSEPAITFNIYIVNRKKIKRFAAVGKNINRKHNKAAAKQNLANKLDSLFDIAGRSCSLEVLRCDGRRINCDVDNCQQEHIFCSCSPALKVPIEDRAYLRDQRLKKGPKGLLQMASADRVTVKRALRSSASFPRSTVDFSSFPCTSIQSSTDTDSASVHSEASFNKQYVAITASDTTIMQSH